MGRRAGAPPSADATLHGFAADRLRRGTPTLDPEARPCASLCGGVLLVLSGRAVAGRLRELTRTPAARPVTIRIRPRCSSETRTYLYIVGIRTIARAAEPCSRHRTLLTVRDTSHVAAYTGQLSIRAASSPRDPKGRAPEHARFAARNLSPYSCGLDPGVGTIRAIEGLVEFGMTPSEAIVAATKNGGMKGARRVRDAGSGEARRHPRPRCRPSLRHL